MKRVAILAVALSLGATAAFAADHVNVAKGFNANSVYQINDYDAINAFNGNLTISIPIGSAYPIADGYSLQLVLHSNANAWDAEEYVNTSNCDDGHYTVAYAHRRANAGMGWILTLGRLYDPSDPTGNGSWTYESPDGADHQFWTTLVEGQGTSTPGISYTRDGTYLRMTVAGTARKVEFPDGTIHTFKQRTAGDTQWSLESVKRRYKKSDGTVDENELYRVEYTDDVWTISEHGRSHVLTFIPKTYDGDVSHRMIDKVETNGSVYQFQYRQATIGRQKDIDNVPKLCRFNSTTVVQLLSAIVLPDATRFTFEYDDTDDGIGPSGLPQKMTVPTGGSVQWTWDRYNKPEWSASDTYFRVGWGVSKRTLGSNASGWSYVQTPHDDAIPGDDTQLSTKYQLTTITDPAGKVTENYFWVARHPISFILPDHDYGRPFAKIYPDASGTRFLSQRVLSGGQLRQSTYVRYEDDEQSQAGWGPVAGGRIASQNVVDADAGKNLVTNYSDYDGVGHYRVSTVTGTAVGNVIRTTTTNYAGVSTIPAGGPWITGLYTDVTTTETGVPVGAAASSHVSVCFDHSTGFLLRRRSGRSTPSKDLLAVFTPDAYGNTIEEKYYGGDASSVPVSEDLCALSPGDATYKMLHTYDHGVRKLSKYDGVSFNSTDFVIDASTGLPSAGADPAGVTTTYGYDALGRFTELHPTGAAWTHYAYTGATSSVPAGVTVTQWPEGAAEIAGTELGMTRYYYDGFGRMIQQSRRMPATWSTVWSESDVLGRKIRETTARSTATGNYAPAPSGGNATFWTYDALGRVITITQPDGKVVSFAYTGNRTTSRTVNIATVGDTENANGEETNVTSAVTPVTTIEEVDGFGRLIKVTEGVTATSPGYVTTYEYDVGNHLVAVHVDNNAQNRQFTYDGSGLLTEESHPESGVTTYTYDARGHVLTRTSGPTSLAYAYDAAERLTSVKSGGLTLKEFTFDRQDAGSPDDRALGKLDQSIRYHRHPAFPGGLKTVTETYKYTGPGGAISEKITSVGGQTFTDKYEYDPLGALGKVVYPTCVGCTGLGAPVRAVTTKREFGLTTEVGSYANAIQYYPSGLLKQIQHLNRDGENGPLYQQLQDNEMARPAKILVSRFCTDIDNPQALPAQQTVNADGQFTITVAVPAGASVQWYERTSEGEQTLLNETNATLSRTADVTRSYFARLANATCSADSTIATVNVAASCGNPASTISMPEPIANVTTTAAVSPTFGATYVWTMEGSGQFNGATNQPTVTFTPGCSGTIKLKVKVSTNCVEKQNETSVVTIAPAKASVSGSTTIPGDGSVSPTIQVSLSGHGPWTIQWSDGVTEQVTTAVWVRTISPPPAMTTIYSIVSVIDGLQCPGASDGSSATVTVGTSSCVTPNSDFDAMGPVFSSSINTVGALTTVQSYAWTVTNGTILDNTQNSPQVKFRAGCAGNVTLTLTSTASCGKSSSTSKTFPIVATRVKIRSDLTLPNVYVRGDAPIPVKFEAAGIVPTLRWSDGALQTNLIASFDINEPSILSRLVQPATTTTYSVVDVRDLFGCPGEALNAVTVTVCDAPIVEISAPLLITPREVGSASLPDEPGTAYTWSVSDGILLSGQGTRAITFRSTDSCTLPVTLQVTATNSCGITRSKTVTVAVRSATATVTGSATIAQGNSTPVKVTLVGVPPWTVRWSGDANTSTVQFSSQTLLPEPDGTTTYTVASATDVRGCTATVLGEAVVTVIPPVPTQVTATATTVSQIVVSWENHGVVDQFTVFRDGVPIASVNDSPYVDAAVIANRTYVYRVAAVKTGVSSPQSAPDLATTMLLGASVAAGDVVDAQIIFKLRSAVNAVRAAAGLPAAAFTDADIVHTVVRVVHITELRQALEAARSALSLSGIAYGRTPLESAFEIRASELMEIQGGVQ